MTGLLHDIWKTEDNKDKGKREIIICSEWIFGIRYVANPVPFSLVFGTSLPDSVTRPSIPNSRTRTRFRDHKVRIPGLGLVIETTSSKFPDSDSSKISGLVTLWYQLVMHDRLWFFMGWFTHYPQKMEVLTYYLKTPIYIQRGLYLVL